MSGNEFIAAFCMSMFWLMVLFPLVADGKFRNMSNAKFVLGLIYAPMLIFVIIAKILF